MEIQVSQKTQDFLFGNLIFDLVWNDPPYRPELFKRRFLELFNLAIFPFYWPFYEKNAWTNRMAENDAGAGMVPR